MRFADSIDRSNVFAGSDIKDLQALGRFRRYEQPAMLQIDTEVIEMSIYISRKSDALNQFQLTGGPAGQERS